MFFSAMPRSVLLRTVFLRLLIVTTALLIASVDAGAEPVKIGAILPLTGDASFWGVHPRRAIEAALSDISRRETSHSEPAESDVRVVFEDDQCDPKLAVSAFRKLVEQDGVRVILGPSCSSSVAAIEPLLKGTDVLLVAFAEAPFTEVGDHIVRLWIPSDRQARVIAEDMRVRQHLSRVAVLFSQNAFGESTAKAFVEAFEKAGGTVVGQEGYSPDVRDFKAPVLRLNTKKPDSFYFVSYIADGVGIVRQLRELRITASLNSASTINSPEFFNPLGRLADGITFTDIEDASDTKFRESWNARFGDDWPGAQSGIALFYDFTHLLVEGRTKLQSGPQFRDFLLQHAAYKGASGDLKFDPTGNLTYTHSVFLRSGGHSEAVTVPRR